MTLTLTSARPVLRLVTPPKTESAAQTLILRRAHLLTLENAQGVRLAALSGRLWVTQEGDLQDYLIETGGQFLVTRPGKTVVQAVTDAMLYVAPCL